jgi:hypothetical protein
MNSVAQRGNVFNTASQNFSSIYDNGARASVGSNGAVSYSPQQGTPSVFANTKSLYSPDAASNQTGSWFRDTQVVSSSPNNAGQRWFIPESRGGVQNASGQWMSQNRIDNNYNVNQGMTENGLFSSQNGQPVGWRVLAGNDPGGVFSRTDNPTVSSNNFATPRNSSAVADSNPYKNQGLSDAEANFFNEQGQIPTRSSSITPIVTQGSFFAPDYERYRNSLLNASQSSIGGPNARRSDLNSYYDDPHTNISPGGLGVGLDGRVRTSPYGSGQAGVFALAGEDDGLE